ncbi:MAG: DUF3343 domain-containing protein [Bacillota bacterium]
MTPRLYLLFRSTHETLKAEALLQGAGIACRVVQKPSAIRMDCGLALRTSPTVQQEALGALRGAGLEPRGVFEV